MSKRTHIEIIDLSDDEVTEPKVQKTEEKTEPTLPWFVTVLNTLKAKYPPVEGKKYPYFTGSKPKLGSYDEFKAKYFTPLEEFILKQEKDTVSDPSVKAIETLKYAKNLLLTCEHSLSDDIQFGHIVDDTGNAILTFGLLKPGELPEEFVEEIKNSAEENETSIADEVGESICSLGSDSYVSDSVLEAVTPTYILIHDTKPGYAKEQAFSKYEDKETQQKYRRILKLPYKPNIWVDSCLALRGISEIISEQGLPVEAYTLLIDSALHQFKV